MVSILLKFILFCVYFKYIKTTLFCTSGLLILHSKHIINILSPKQNDRHFPISIRKYGISINHFTDKTECQ